MRILNFGSCNIDFVYSVAHITGPGETNAADSVAFYPGGKGLNQSIALARAGAAVYHAGCIGEDGMMLREAMSHAGADLRYLKTVDEKTGHAIIQVDRNGENCIIVYPGANAKISRDQIDTVLSDFAAGDCLLAQNEICELPYLITQAAAKGMQVVLNPSPFHEDLKHIDLRLIRYLVLNEVEADCLFGTQDPAAIRQLLMQSYPNLNIVLTLGKKGSVFLSQSFTCQQNAFLVETVDTTAAGDTFTGYFLAGITDGMQPQDAMRFASVASALAVSKKGAASSIPNKGAVMDALNTLSPIT